ncbi:hypothetical protein GCM10009760_30820 [Kitasatospora kazusensis]|uniref:Uncharacterized protein n=1 Tax=Kitasatospora kazusensis TaxID=407974 RepID=A0ABP5LC58_9ACTN
MVRRPAGVGDGQHHRVGAPRGEWAEPVRVSDKRLREDIGQENLPGSGTPWRGVGARATGLWRERGVPHIDAQLFRFLLGKLRGRAGK